MHGRVQVLVFCVLYTGVCLVANWLACGYALPSVHFYVPVLTNVPRVDDVFIGVHNRWPYASVTF